MTSQADHANTFRALHIKGDPVTLYNVWDAGSAKAVGDAGAKAIATGSAPVAMANGAADGQQFPLDLALANIGRISSAVDLPVTMDLEGGYSTDPIEAGENFARGIAAGPIGFNFEDQVVGGEGLHDIATQSTRIKAARAACDSTGVPAFINARSDIFLKALKAQIAPTPAMLDEAVTRARAYAEAGADGFFAVGLMDIAMIAEQAKSALNWRD
ncbi:isocitrate lyase/phosphoenolpyruvate mutase family protein [Alisedimentitalea sp. MJ-SS2]|uniref:isocitrate lyase/PEP mutase family protein n=1 Tax=Aliisedimentitalea sp. MJ-SS2 TaxID=3049795 RepID=UPI002907F61B|nr:isocitrate lyase/phosphoenolpyruvate mutase family protein [Alisedimentitalea sp. MJ-SS2]MDU8929306.1 isocitrate lyase/phosphoenolpyruvate mutase family protein [Alisedimentitalea sp. MJ-SS2]